MKKRHIFFRLLLMLLPCCLLAGGKSLIKSDQMDQQLEQLITALNEDNADQIYQFMYPGVVTREEFETAYEEFQLAWVKSTRYTTKLNAINVKNNFSNSGSSKTWQAQYYVFTEDTSYTITLAYLSDSDGAGLYQLNLASGTGPLLISGGFTTARENSFIQWFVLIFSILGYVFILITIIDIIGKRPRLFGVWIGAALTFLGFRVLITPSGFQAGGGPLWFVLSSFRIYSDGTRNFVLAIPVGAIVYWCLRKKTADPKTKG